MATKRRRRTRVSQKINIPDWKIQYWFYGTDVEIETPETFAWDHIGEWQACRSEVMPLFQRKHPGKTPFIEEEIKEKALRIAGYAEHRTLTPWEKKVCSLGSALRKN